MIRISHKRRAHRCSATKPLQAYNTHGRVLTDLGLALRINNHTDGGSDDFGYRLLGFSAISRGYKSSWTVGVCERNTIGNAASSFPTGFQRQMLAGLTHFRTRSQRCSSKEGPHGATWNAPPTATSLRNTAEDLRRAATAAANYGGISREKRQRYIDHVSYNNGVSRVPSQNQGCGTSIPRLLHYYTPIPMILAK